MFSEILWIKPKLDPASINSMEKSLGQRFGGVAKKFGGALKIAMLAGGAIGAAVAIGGAIIEKMLNPLGEVTEKFDKLLDKSADLSTFARQFGTTEGNLFRLQTLGEARGLDAEGVRRMLMKFQGARTDLAKNPEAESGVRGFNQKDTAEAFFAWVQGLQKMTDVQRDYVERLVLGERAILRDAEFLNTPDFTELMKNTTGFGNTSGDTALIRHGSKLDEQKKEGMANINAHAYLKQVGQLTSGEVSSEIAKQQRQNEEDNRRLTQESFKHLQGLDEKMDIVMKKISEATDWLTVNADKLINGIISISKSRLMKGYISGGKDD